MNGRYRTFGAAAVIVALLLIGAIAMSVAGRDEPGGAVAAETDATRTITVSGEGRVSVRPDILSMQFGVDVLDADLGTAQSDAAARMEAVIAALRTSGIAERDIQTSGYSISVERDYNRTDQPIVGYRVSQTVTVKARDFDRAGQVIQAAVAAGANNVWGVWFGLENPQQAVNQARELAVADARAKAEELARLANATLGPVQTIVEGYAPGSPPVPYAGAAEQRADDMALAPPINPGQTEVTLTVTVTWAMTS